MTNRYKGNCCYCGKYVPAYSGTCFKNKGARKFSVACTICGKSKAPSVITTYFPSTDSTVWVNSTGRCEDAPCCGCCS